jgi:hypothetical protein
MNILAFPVALISLSFCFLSVSAFAADPVKPNDPPSPAAGQRRQLSEFDWSETKARFEPNDREDYYDHEIDHVKKELERERTSVMRDLDGWRDRLESTQDWGRGLEERTERAKAEIFRLKNELGHLYHEELHEIEQRRDLKPEEIAARREEFRDRMRGYVRVVEDFEHDVLREHNSFRRDYDRVFPGTQKAAEAKPAPAPVKEIPPPAAAPVPTPAPAEAVADGADALPESSPLPDDAN